MRVLVRLLEETADRCLQHSNESENAKAARLMRLLAVDLMLAAEQRRNNRGPTMSEQLVELRKLSRPFGKPARRERTATRESALTA